MIKMRQPYSNELMHYGIRGMKWGIRRFQNPDGTLTAAGRRRYGTIENLERGMTKKQASAHDAAKNAAINSGKTSEVQKFSSELTREEMARAVQRIQDEQKLSELRAKDVAAGQQKVKAIIEAGGQLKTAGETVKNVYNLVAQANNAFNKENKLPIIGQDSNNKKPGEKSIEQQTKEFALERMKTKAKWEDEDRAKKNNSDSSNSSGKESKAKEKSEQKAKTSSEGTSSNSSIINRMVNDTGTKSNRASDLTISAMRNTRSGRTNDLASRVDKFISTPSTIEKINNASDAAVSWLKAKASSASSVFDASVASGDNWVRRTYGT